MIFNFLFLLSLVLIILWTQYLDLNIESKNKIKTSIKSFNFFNSTENITSFILIIIIFLGFCLRVIRLDSIPHSLSIDETNLGYYCWASYIPSDEGIKNLVVNPILYFLIKIFINLFGPTPFAVRFGFCILGTLSIYTTYKLTGFYFNKKIALISAFLLAFSPWHIQVSRMAIDNVSFTLFFTLGFYLLSIGIFENKKYLWFSSIPLGLAFFFSSSKLFMFLFLLSFVFINKNEVLKSDILKIKFKVKKIYLIIACLLLFKPVSGFIKNISTDTNKPKQEINNSLSTDKLIKNYSNYLSPDFLLKKGDSDLKYNIGNKGLLPWVTFWMHLLGVFLILKSKNRKDYIFVAWWLISFIPASLSSNDLPSASKISCGLSIFEILASIGIYNLVTKTKYSFSANKQYNYYLLILTFFVLTKGFFNMNGYLSDYFTTYAEKSKNSFNSNFNTLIQTTKLLREFDRIVLPFDIPKFHILFLEGIDPKIYFENKNDLKYIAKNSLVKIPQTFLIKKNIAEIVLPNNNVNSDHLILGIYDDFEKNNLLYKLKRFRSEIKRNYIPKNTGGLKTYYFSGKDFKNLKGDGITPVINFDWKDGSPRQDIKPDEFSISWVGWFKAEKAGLYKFITTNDNGVKVIVSGKQIINDTNLHSPPRENTGEIYLNEGWHPIIVDYYEVFGGSLIKLEVQAEEQEKQLIPKELLSPDDII